VRSQCLRLLVDLVSRVGCQEDGESKRTASDEGNGLLVGNHDDGVLSSLLLWSWMVWSSVMILLPIQRNLFFISLSFCHTWRVFSN
jgi:hypothetical protein